MSLLWRRSARAPLCRISPEARARRRASSEAAQGLCPRRSPAQLRRRKSRLLRGALEGMPQRCGYAGRRRWTSCRLAAPARTVCAPAHLPEQPNSEKGDVLRGNRRKDARELRGVEAVCAGKKAGEERAVLVQHRVVAVLEEGRLGDAHLLA